MVGNSTAPAVWLAGAAPLAAGSFHSLWKTVSLQERLLERSFLTVDETRFDGLQQKHGSLSVGSPFPHPSFCTSASLQDPAVRLLLLHSWDPTGTALCGVSDCSSRLSPASSRLNKPISFQLSSQVMFFLHLCAFSPAPPRTGQCSPNIQENYLQCLALNTPVYTFHRVFCFLLL